MSCLRFVAPFCLSAVLAISVVPAAATESSQDVAASQPVIRVSGADRIATAIATAKAAFTASDHAILATANDWPDSITSTILADDLDAPVLLTSGKLLDSRVAQALQDLNVKHVTILGGSKAVSNHVVDALKTIHINVTRIRGASRAETAANVAKTAKSYADTVVIAPGWGETAWTHAIAGASFSYTDAQAPTLLVNKDSIPQATKDAIRDLRAKRAIVIGGSATISATVEKQLQQLGLSTRRLEAPSPSAMAFKAVHENLGSYSGNNLVVASASSFADALGASALAASTDAPLLLTNSEKVSQTTARWLSGWAKIANVMVIGGEKVISPQVVSQIEEVLKDTKHGTPSYAEPNNPNNPDGSQTPVAATPQEPVDSATPQAPTAADSSSTSKPNPEEPQAGDTNIDVNHAPNSKEYYEALAAKGISLGTEKGVASFYWQGQQTANGERFNTWDLTAAHKSLPFNTIVKVTNLDNGKSVVVRINDRGPYIAGRIIDLSKKAASEIDMINTGVANVQVDIIQYANS